MGLITPAPHNPNALSSSPGFWTDTTADVTDRQPKPFVDDSADSLPQRIEAMQKALDDVRAQLTESQRLATIGTIAAVIAHEFNNLLTPIVSYSQYALQSAESAKPDAELIKKALSKAFQGSTKAGRICTSMLGLARGESSFGEVDVRQLVDDTLSVLARD